MKAHRHLEERVPRITPNIAQGVIELPSCLDADLCEHLHQDVCLLFWRHVAERIQLLALLLLESGLLEDLLVGQLGAEKT